MPPERLAYGIGLNENTPDRPQINRPKARWRGVRSVQFVEIGGILNFILMLWLE